jgi:predicted DNA-binding protein
MATVVRSMHLSVPMDEHLNGLAFLLNRPKSEVIRWCISQGLTELISRLGRREPPEEVARGVRTDITDQIEQAQDADIRRLISTIRGER